METLVIPANEQQRIEALKRYNILDTPTDGTFDRITALAASIFKVPIAIISLVDTDRIWFKSHFGLTLNQINRDGGLCASAILSNDPYIVENASEDPRCLANPLVAGDFGLRFYAAVPLHTSDSYNLGTLCLLDKSPRKFTEHEREILMEMGKIVMDEMELRLAIRDTVYSVKSITSDIDLHLSDSIRFLDTPDSAVQKDKIRSHLDASRLFIRNLQQRLNDL
ncbi:MAG: GAF domain-containing protein [Bacteroidota bacterium]